MKKLSLLGIAGLLALALPASAEPVPTAPCAESTEYARVGLAGAHEDVTPSLMPGWPGADPLVDHDYGDDSAVRFRYRIDISGSPAHPFAQTADVRIVLSFDSPSAYALYVWDANGELLGWDARYTYVGRATEIVFLPQVSHCADLRVDVVTLIGLPLDELALDSTLGSLE